MNPLKKITRTAARKAALLTCGTAFSILGFIGSCDQRLITATRYVDPCGTVLANCEPGSFLVNNANVADYCVDPACTIPGQCGQEGPVLGTITRICP